MTQVKTTRETFAESLNLLHEIAMYIPILEKTMDDRDKASTEREFDKIDNHLDMVFGAIYDVMHEYMHGKDDRPESDELPF